MEMTLSLACMMKVDRPSARLGRIIFASSRRFFNRIFSMGFFAEQEGQHPDAGHSLGKDGGQRCASPPPCESRR